MKLLAFTLVAGLCLAAGCAAPALDTTSDSTDGPVPPAPSSLVVALDGCRQFHTFFESPMDGFAQYVPEGFSIKPSQPNGQLTTVPVFASDCSNGTEMFALLQVIPPAEHANATFSIDAVILTGFTSNATDLATYMAWGLPRMLHASSVSRTTNDLVAAYDEEITVGDGSTAYTLHTNVQMNPGANEATTYRYWATNGTTATGYVIVQNLPGQTLGAGSALYSQTGDPGAPPFTAGIAHRVNNVPVRIAGHALPAVAGNQTA